MSDNDATGLAQGAWLPEIHEALQTLIEQHGINSPDYDPENPPVAAIDCGETLICNHLGEAMMRYLVTRRKLNTERGFWHVITDRGARDALSAAYKAVAGRADSEVRDTAAYRRYRAGMLNVYENLRETDGAEAAALFAARMLKGLHERTVAELVEEVLDYELGRPLGQEDIAAGPPFGGLVVPSGVRVYHEMLELLQTLEVYGFQTWILSSANVYILRALARRIGFPEERVLGLELQVQSGCYTERPVDDVPVGEGKLELFLDTVGRSPLLAIGDSMNDFELLENCEGLSIVIDRGDEELIERAEEMDWPVQPQLSV